MSNQIVFIVGFVFFIACSMGCKDKTVELEDNHNQEAHFGVKVYLKSKSGELFEHNSFLPLPLNHCIMKNNEGDTLDVLLMAEPIYSDSTYVFPFGYFEVKEGENIRKFIFALPEDKSKLVMERKGFQEFMLSNYPVMQIIDTWFSNYKGQSKTRVQNWQETYFAEDVVKNFLKLDVVSNVVDTIEVTN